MSFLYGSDDSVVSDDGAGHRMRKCIPASSYRRRIIEDSDSEGDEKSDPSVDNIADFTVSANGDSNAEGAELLNQISDASASKMQAESSESSLDVDLNGLSIDEGAKPRKEIIAGISVEASISLNSSDSGEESDDSSYVTCNQASECSSTGAQPSGKRCSLADTLSTTSHHQNRSSIHLVGKKDDENRSPQSSVGSFRVFSGSEDLCSLESSVSFTSPASNPPHEHVRKGAAEKSFGPHIAPQAKKRTPKDVEDAEPCDSAWTLDGGADDYFLTGNLDAIKGEVQWPKLRVPKELYEQLYDHQKVGVQWMASMHDDGIGGILGDDMGLGKTYQTLTYLGGLMRVRTIKSALVVCPMSILRTWEREAREILERSCMLDVTITVISSDVKKQRRNGLLSAAMMCSSKYPHLAITTYGLVTSNPLDFVLTEKDGEKLAWDYVVLDEGHKIKNHSTKTNKSCHRICRNESTHRLLLTGTPIQNNLRELWSLFDWATSGRLLGKLPNFLNRFGLPIEEARHKNATESTIAIAEKANKELQELLRPHFLQRLKSEEFKDELPTKREIVVWTHLSEKQRDMYEDYVENGGNVRSILAGEISSPLEAITWLKKLCGHPSLVSWNTDDWNSLLSDDVEPKKLVRDSAKLQVLVDLLKRLRRSGHKTLIFSQSTKMLDIMERVLRRMALARIDGTTKERERQRIVDSFNKEGSRFDALLLSTKAAGLGLTLTGADRCVVYDPSWNPAEDSQAVDRCFRIGQLKRVTVYRFIAAGTVEERMYEKQVFKDGIRRAVMTNKGSSTERYFNKDELRRLFQLAPEGECEILEKFRGEVAKKHSCDEDEADVKNTSFVVGASGKPSFLDSHRNVIGLSSHDHLYTNAIAACADTDPVEESQSTPFAGTPLKERKLGRAGRALMGKKLEFGSTTPTEQYHISGEVDVKNKATALGNPNKGRRPLASVTHDEDNILASEPLVRSSEDRKNKKISGLAITKPLRTPDLSPVNPACQKDGIVLGQNDFEEAMGLLLDELDRNRLKGDDKLQLHKRIANMAVRLGWL